MMKNLTLFLLLDVYYYDIRYYFEIVDAFAVTSAYFLNQDSNWQSLGCFKANI
jgi:hypothetical protein